MISDLDLDLSKRADRKALAAWVDFAFLGVIDVHELSAVVFLERSSQRYRGLRYWDVRAHAHIWPRYAEDWNVTPSFGRTGVCWDNAAMESTWATVKKEIRHIHGDWATMTRSQLRTILFDYIETFHNRRRH